MCENLCSVLCDAKKKHTQPSTHSVEFLSYSRRPTARTTDVGRHISCSTSSPRRAGGLNAASCWLTWVRSPSVGRSINWISLPTTWVLLTKHQPQPANIIGMAATQRPELHVVNHFCLRPVGTTSPPHIRQHAIFFHDACIMWIAQVGNIPRIQRLVK